MVANETVRMRGEEGIEETKKKKKTMIVVVVQVMTIKSANFYFVFVNANARKELVNGLKWRFSDLASTAFIA